ncbi:hypothetical protein BDZ89DRAFT_665077 [Hymenopellis radicata]|nr:hypothetical protein BDZ89DRAFT_665077 [Hymenopellis radicata]
MRLCSHSRATSTLFQSLLLPRARHSSLQAMDSKDEVPIYAPIPILGESYSPILRYEEDEDGFQWQDEDGDSGMSDTDIGSDSESKCSDDESDDVDMEPLPALVLEAVRLLETEGIVFNDFTRLEGRLHGALCGYGDVGYDLFYASATTASPPPEGADTMAFLLKEAVRLITASGDDLSAAELRLLREDLYSVLVSFGYAHPELSMETSDLTVTAMTVPAMQATPTLTPKSLRLMKPRTLRPSGRFHPHNSRVQAMRL